MAILVAGMCYVPSYEAAGADVLLFFDVPLLSVFFSLFLECWVGRLLFRRQSPFATFLV